MRCTLHIGTEKTGTTTLQRLLRQNRSALLDKGLYVPTAFGPLEHYHLVSYGLRRGRFFKPLARAGVHTEAEVEAFRSEVRRKFEHELGQLDADSNIVLSSERCFRTLRRRGEIRRLVDMLTHYCDELDVIVYLRPQHDYCVSLYSTKLKNGFAENDIFPADVSKKAHLDYAETLQRWASVVGEDKITVRIFDRAELVDGDIGADFFFHALGLNVADFEPVSNENESLNVEGQLFLRELNEHLPRFDGEQLSQRRGNIGGLMGQIASGRGMLPSEGAARHFFEQFADSNEQVRSTWLPDRATLFDPDFSKYPSSPMDDELSREDAFAIFAALWSLKEQEVAQLKAQIARPNQ